MALANQKQIEDLADSLTVCADSIHERLMKAIKGKSVEQTEAQSLFQDETILRQKANSLYIDAAKCVVEGLEIAQTDLLNTIKTATDEIKKIKKIAAFIDLVADILALAAAAYASKPGPVVAALKEIKIDIEALSKG